MSTTAPWGLVDVRPILRRSGPGDAGVAAIASAQHRLVTTPQLRFAGLSRHEISFRASRGRIHRLHRGVYAVGCDAISDVAALAAAVLACGRRSVISHQHAAFLAGMMAFDSGPINVGAMDTHRRSRPGITVHRIATLGDRDVRRRHLIPMTSPTMTILDLAERCGSRAAESALNEARTKRLVRRDDFIDLRRRTAGRAGWGTLLPLLRVDGTDDFSRQAAEKALTRLIRRAGLPVPRRNIRVHGHELDFYWPELRLNVELDGYQWHSARNDLNRDRERDTHLASLGIAVVRFTRDQLKFELEKVSTRLGAAIALAQRAAR